MLLCGCTFLNKMILLNCQLRMFCVAWLLPIVRGSHFGNCFALNARVKNCMNDAHACSTFLLPFVRICVQQYMRT